MDKAAYLNYTHLSTPITQKRIQLNGTDRLRYGTSWLVIALHGGAWRFAPRGGSHVEP